MKYSEHSKKLLAWCSEDKLEMEMGRKKYFPYFIGFCGKITLSSCWNRFELDFVFAVLKYPNYSIRKMQDINFY